MFMSFYTFFIFYPFYRYLPVNLNIFTTLPVNLKVGESSALLELSASKYSNEAIKSYKLGNHTITLFIRSRMV